MDKYQDLSISVRGSDHTEQQALLEDYSLTYTVERFQIMVVAGGGNDSQYFRSYLGARFAAEAALKSAITFASTVTKQALHDERTRVRMVRQLEGSIIISWREKVREHLDANPFLDAEIDAIEDEKYRKGYRSNVDLEYAYRSNVMVGIAGKDYYLVIRNGNGECTVLGADSKLDEPVPWNEKCSDSFSTSMCERTAIQEFRHYYSEEAPAALFLMTNGMRRCFEQEEEYHEYIRLLAQKIQRNPEDIEEYLKIYLPELSKKGSHGDMCLAFGWSEAALKKAIQPASKTEIKADQRQKTETKPETKKESNQEIKPDNQRRKWLPVIGIASAAVVAAVIFAMGGDSSGKSESAAIQRLEAETSLESLVETEPVTRDPKEESREKAELEESIRESLKAEMAAETAAAETEEAAIEEFTLEEETTAEEPTAAPETTKATKAPTKPAPTQPPPTQPPTTAAPPPTTAAPPPPETPAPPPTTAAPPPETPPPPPPTTAAPPSNNNSSSDLDNALQMWKTLQ